MRPILLLLLLGACALPDVNAPASPEIARADYPELVPFDRVLGQRVDTSAVSPAANAALEARAARASARQLGEVDTGRLSARAARLRQRADAMRASAVTDAERETIRNRLRELRGRTAAG